MVEKTCSIVEKKGNDWEIEEKNDTVRSSVITLKVSQSSPLGFWLIEKEWSISVELSMERRVSNFLENVIHDVVTYIEHAHQKTVNTIDVVYALERH